jgi:hypothetical protein
MNDEIKSPMQAFFEEAYGRPGAYVDDQLEDDLRKKFQQLRDGRGSGPAFRRLTEEDVVRIFREVLIEEVMEA